MDLFTNETGSAYRGVIPATVPACHAEALEKMENILLGLTDIFTSHELTGYEKDELYRRITMIYVESKEKSFIKT